MKVYAPVENINGIYASVMFVDSVGETNNPALIEWFRNHGYRTEKEFIVPSCEVSRNDSVKENEPDFYSMTPNDLRDWMKEHGYGSKIRNIKSKDKLLEIIRG